MDTHVLCQLPQKGLQWDCRESIAEPVRDKERANFCDYFRLREGPGDQAGEQAGGLPRQRAEQARATPSTSYSIDTL